MRQLQGTHRARGDDDDDDARGEDERKRPGREKNARWGDSERSIKLCAEKTSAILSLGQTKNFDFVDFVDCSPPVLRASVEVSGTRILDYMVTTITSLVVLYPCRLIVGGKRCIRP